MNNNNNKNEGINDANKSTGLNNLAQQDNESVMCTSETLVNFLDAEPGFTSSIPSNPDPTFGVGKADITDIQKFLARPLEIYTWNEGVGPRSVNDFRPWTLFFDNSAVSRKIENFAFLRCKLNLKIVVNAAPTFWGSSFVSYVPRTDLYADLQPALSEASQRLKIITNPTNSQGGCLCLPFFHYKNWITVREIADFDFMGRVYINPIGDMRCTDSLNTGTVGYKVYAWATDVELSQSTTALALQAGEEWATGPVSGVASTVANVASKLTHVGILAPYARATAIASTAVGRIAHIFGFSRTPVIDNPRVVKNKPFGNTADCGTHEVVDRLCVDPKNELCVDSRTVGLDGTDEMSIISIASRESYIGRAEWKTSDINDTILCTCQITPMIIASGAGFINYPSALDFAARPFRYWRGDIIIRVLVVASKFHRGRLLIQWDPTAALPSTANTNVVASQVVDLAVSRDVQFRVPYAAALPFLMNEPAESHSELFKFYSGVAITPTYNALTNNGVLNIKILNPLNSIETTTDPVDVAVFVKAADNFEVAVPRDTKFATVTSGISLQSGETPDDSQPGDFAPEGVKEVTVVDTIPVSPDPMYMTCFGEKVVSFRTLIKRYNYSLLAALDGAGPTGAWNKLSMTLPTFPLPRGYTDNGYFLDGVDPCNVSSTTLLNYLQGAFVGMRGSTRWKFGIPKRDPIDEIMVSRPFTARSYIDYITLSSSSLASGGQRSSDEMQSAIVSPGYLLTNGKTQCGVEVDIPMYTNARFVSASPYNVGLGKTRDGTQNHTMRLEMRSGENIVSDRSYVSVHSAAGDDFSFFYFVNAPRQYGQVAFTSATIRT